MACRRNLRQNLQPPLNFEQSTSLAIREATHGEVVQGTTSPPSLGAENSSIADLRQKIDELRREVKAMKDCLADLEDIRNSVSAFEDAVKSELKKMREESSAMNKLISMKVDKIYNFITGKNDAGKDLPHWTKFEWRVEIFSKLKDQALNGKAKFFYSENFYVGSHGYKMHLGATLAEKNCKGKVSLSVYAYINRGPYDRTLQWPYSRRSTFIIVDQKTNHHHKVAEMVPQQIGRKHDHCFQRPKSGRNEGIGFTALLSLEDLEDPEKGYIMKDSFVVHFITSDE